MSLPSPRALARIPFVKDLFLMQIGKVVPTLCGFLSSIILPNILGLDGFGRYAIVLSFIGIVSLFTNLGQQHATIAFLAEAYGKKDKITMRSIGRYYMQMSILTIVVLGIVSPFLPLLTQKIYGSPVIGQLGQIVFFASICDPLYNYLAIVLQTVREIRMLSIIENAYLVFQLGLGIFLALTGRGVAGILWGSAITSFLSIALALILLPGISKKHGLPTLQSLFVPELPAMKRYFRDGFWIALDKNISNLYPNLFMFALSLRSTETSVGLVRLAFKYGNLPASFVLSNISRLAASVVPTMIGKGGANLRQSMLRLLRSTVAVHVATTIVVGIAVPIAFPFLYGRGFGDALRPFWVVLTLHLTLAVHALLTPILRIKKRVYLATIFNITGLAIGLTAFFLTAGSTLTPLWAFSLALACYHLLSLCIVFPAIRLIRQPT